MIQLLTESVALVNMPFTLLLIIVLVYWLMMIAGLVSSEAVGMGSADADVHVGGDLDMDADADLGGGADADIHADASPMAKAEAGSALAGYLQMVNAGRVPLVIVISFFALFLWMGAMLLNHYLNPGKNILLGIALIIPNYIAGILLTKIAIMPLKPIFTPLKVPKADNVILIGRTCKMLTPLEGDRVGQAELHTDEAVYRLTVKSQDGKRIEKDETVVVVSQDTDRNVYTVG